MPLALPPLPRGSSFVFLALAVVPLCKSQKPNRCRVWLACWSHRAAVLSSFLSRHANPSRKQKGRQNLAASSSRKTPSYRQDFFLRHPRSTRSRLALRSLRYGRKPFHSSTFCTLRPNASSRLFFLFYRPAGSKERRRAGKNQGYWVIPPASPLRQCKPPTHRTARSRCILPYFFHPDFFLLAE